MQGVLQERGDSGRQWLERLPERAAHYLREWNLRWDGLLHHGYLGVVLLVEGAALKLTWVDPETRREAEALELWNGRGAARLFKAVPEQGVLLLERLQAERSLEQVEIQAATRIAAGLLRQLAVPVGPEWEDGQVQEQARLARQRWDMLGEPFPLDWIECPGGPSQGLFVHQDLHFGNVLAAERTDWLAIDPKVIRGDLEFGVAPLLWNRTDQGQRESRFDWIVEQARLEPVRALQWLRFRAAEYCLWAWSKGLDQVPRDLAAWAAARLSVE